MSEIQGMRGNYVPRYYEDLGRGHDYLMRCKDCKRLVTFEVITKSGCCPSCGNRRVVEITTLTFWEWLKIRVGVISFHNRREFLKEFNRA